jgi:hypothetical protein
MAVKTEGLTGDRLWALVMIAISLGAVWAAFSS